MAVYKVANLVVSGVYRDSVQLMEVSESIKRLKGVVDAAVVMGTVSNKESLKPLGLLTSEGEKAGPNDIIIAVKAAGNIEEILETSKKLLFETHVTAPKYISIEEALNANPDVKFASISIPGGYVEEVAVKLIEGNVNLFIFSDHVPIETEVSLKRKASSRDLLVMGPEAGTAFIAGVGFGFANNVLRGNVGVVASAGSGIQEFVTLLDRYGIGVSHAIGVGARDLSEKVGGIMAQRALRLLNGDSDTKFIAFIAKHSDINVVKRILEEEKISKPLALCLLGVSQPITDQPQSHTLHGLVMHIASQLSRGKRDEMINSLLREADTLKKMVSHEPGFPRGFYSGGTLATETAYVWNKAGLEIYSNIGLSWIRKLDNPYTSIGATIVDYGSEEFTEGRPHPIIDPTLRNRRIVTELESDSTNSIAMDLIIGYGAPDNIVSKVFDEIGEAVLKNRKKRLAVRVVGTDKDYQWPQVSGIEKFGVLTSSSNAMAAVFTAACGKNDPSLVDFLISELILEVEK